MTFALVSQIYSNAQQSASTFAGQAQSNLSSAWSVGGTSAPQVTPASFYFSPNVVEPDVYIPTTAERAGFEAFREIWEETIADLSGRFTSFITEYFPDDTEYINETQKWLYDTIANGGTGINPAVEEQIWERERARIVREANRAEQSVIGSWAARGFPLPTGAAAHALHIVRQEARDKIAEASSKVAITQAELEQKNVQFAVEHSIKLWSGAMEAASKYIAAIATGPSAAGQIVPSITDSQSKLISAASQYYNSRIAVQELRLKSGQIPAQWYQDANLKNGDLQMEYVKTRVQAATEGARVAGTMAAAALNALHASVGINNSSGVNFSYQGETTGPLGPG